MYIAKTFEAYFISKNPLNPKKDTSELVDNFKRSKGARVQGCKGLI